MESELGMVTCGSWIRRPENVNLMVLGKSRTRNSSSSSVLEIFSFDPNTTSLSSSPLATHVLEETEGDPVTIAVHPSGDEFVFYNQRWLQVSFFYLSFRHLWPLKRLKSNDIIKELIEILLMGFVFQKIMTWLYDLRVLFLVSISIFEAIFG